MAGRDQVKNINIEALFETRKEIDFSKTVFVFIHATQKKPKSTGDDFIDLVDDLFDVVDLTEILARPPFSVRRNRIFEFVDAKDNTAVYSKIKAAVNHQAVENLFIFYQGYSYLGSDGLNLLLERHMEKLQEKAIRIADISGLVSLRPLLNTVLFLDCSFSARAFDEINSSNFVIISSSGRDQNAGFVEVGDKGRMASLFSFSLLEVFRGFSEGRLGELTIYELYEQIRVNMLTRLKSIERTNFIQVPEISTRNLAPYLKIKALSQAPYSTSVTKKMPTAKQLKELITNDLQAALQKLSVTEGLLSSDERNTVLVFLSTNKQNGIDKINNVITHETYNVRKSALVLSVLNFIDLIKDKIPNT